MIHITEDGSSTVYSECFKQHYHSIYGAKQESEHIYIGLGLKYIAPFFQEINIFEMGFGTGLNALLTEKAANEYQLNIKYTTVEAYPLEQAIYNSLSFDARHFHEASWSNVHAFSPNFQFKKLKMSIQDFDIADSFNLVYYDAFAPESQPELWTVDIFEKIAKSMCKGGVLMSYCCKKYVQRNLKKAGFTIEKHQGPKGKREVLRAILQ